MVMEFLTEPWMPSFFKEDTEKYIFSHINKSVFLMCYATAIDHFQHIIYKHPEYTPDQRATAWKAMEEMYLPDYKMNASDYLSSGRFWQKVMHIYEKPFYSIDYVLALVCAFQFWQKAKVDRKSVWKDYLELCEKGGSSSFLEVIKSANIDSPFGAGTVRNVAKGISNYLNSVDDSSF